MEELSEHAKSIRARREALNERLNEAQRGVDHVRVDMKHLTRDCRHENQYRRDHYAGEYSTFCSDCGALIYG